MFLLALAVSLVSFLLALLLTPLARRLALRIDLVDHPQGRKSHQAPTPYLGGLAIFGAFAGGFIAMQFLPISATLSRLTGLSADELKQFLDAPDVDRRLWFILAGGLLIFTMGLLDDRYALRPSIKLAVQVAVAAAVAVAGVRVEIYGVGLSTLISVMWVVGITNSFNFLDNMDGLSAGVALVAAIMFFVVTMQTDQGAIGLTCAALAGATAGFLVFNFNPASIFMGDAGSLFLGFTLACLTMTTRFYQVGEGQTLLRLAMPVLIMGLPLFDTASVMWIRLREGRPLMQGDRSHFSHRLAALGMSVREAVLTNYLVAAVTGLGATLLIYVDATGGAVILAQAFIVLSLVALLERTGRRKP